MEKVFISFKNSVNGITTQDSVYAKALFDALTAAGIPCFFSNATLEEEGADKYMEKIQEALFEAKAIVVVCGAKEYICTGWVKQEWMTYLNLSVSDSSRSIFSFVLPSFGGTDMLPAFLRPYQSFRNIEDTVKFISNSFNHNDGITNDEKNQFYFWDMFFGIYCNGDKKKALDFAHEQMINAPIVEVLEAMYCLYINDKEKALAKLNNAMLAQCVSAFYFYANYLIVNRISLKEAKKVLSEGYKCFAERKTDGAKLALILCTHKDCLNRTFYCGEILQNILLAVNYPCDLIQFPENGDLSQYEYVVYFLGDEAETQYAAVSNSIFASKGKCMLLLNNFMEGALPKNMRNYTIYNCDDEELAKVAKYLIGQFAK